jgi:hypothetical protein
VEVKALVGTVNADREGQRKHSPQGIKDRLERFPTAERTIDIEVQGYEDRQEKKHGDAKEHDGRHVIWPFYIRPTLASLLELASNTYVS